VRCTWSDCVTARRVTTGEFDRHSSSTVIANASVIINLSAAFLLERDRFRISHDINKPNPPYRLRQFLKHHHCFALVRHVNLNSLTINPELNLSTICRQHQLRRNIFICSCPDTCVSITYTKRKIKAPLDTYEVRSRASTY
jgi:hypothetical protein